MPIEALTPESLGDIRKRIEILERLVLLSTQEVPPASDEAADQAPAKTDTEKLRDQATAQFELDSTKAKLAFAELAGIKAALGDTKLPEGKAGTVTFAAGTAGTALLRSKAPLLTLLDDVAAEFAATLSADAVVVTEAQLEQSYQADFVQTRITQQGTELEAAISKVSKELEAKQPRFGVAPLALPAAIAGVYSGGMLLDAVNGMLKLLRADTKVDVFAADTEVPQLLSYLLEARNPRIVTNPSFSQEQFLKQAALLLDALNALLSVIRRGEDLMAKLKKIEEAETAAKIDPSQSKLPDPATSAELKANIERARSFVDSLSPAAHPDAFWPQVKGQVILANIEGRARLMLEIKAQAVQITRSWWYRGDAVYESGELQVAFRIFDSDGKLQRAGVILRASPHTQVELGSALNRAYPPRPGSRLLDS